MIYAHLLKAVIIYTLTDKSCKKQTDAMLFWSKQAIYCISGSDGNVIWSNTFEIGTILVVLDGDLLNRNQLNQPTTSGPSSS